MASISEPFIRRPVGTTLLAIGLFLVGVVAYDFLPVAAVPNVDFPLDPRFRDASRRRSIGDGGNGRSTAGTAARRNRRDRPDHLDQFARHHQHPVAVRHRPQHRPRCARRTGRDQRFACGFADRPAVIAALPQGQSSGRAGVRFGADVEDDLDQRDLRRRRHRDRTAHFAGAGRRRGQRQRRRPARRPHRAQSGSAVERRHCHGRRQACDHQRQSAGPGRHLQWRPPERDPVDQPADAHRCRIPRHRHQEFRTAISSGSPMSRRSRIPSATAARSPGSTSSRRC